VENGKTVRALWVHRIGMKRKTVSCNTAAAAVAVIDHAGMTHITGNWWRASLQRVNVNAATCCSSKAPPPSLTSRH